jgi:hypothetical protein
VTGWRPSGVMAPGSPSTARLNECCFSVPSRAVTGGADLLSAAGVAHVRNDPPGLTRPIAPWTAATTTAGAACRHYRCLPIVACYVQENWRASATPRRVGPRLAIMRGARQPAPARRLQLSRSAGWSGQVAKNLRHSERPRGRRTTSSEDPPRGANSVCRRHRRSAAATRLVFAIH